jgi:hypothetical protein
MKRLFAMLLCTMLASPLALAQDKAKGKPPTEAQKKQQERMAACNKQAGSKKGEERKKFMSGCLKAQDTGAGPAPSAAQKAQQDRMADCNKQANLKNMKGEQRKTFMSSCLKS